MVTYRIEILVAADAMVMRDTMVIISVSMSSTFAYILLTKNAAWRTNKIGSKNLKPTLNASEKLIDIDPQNCILYYTTSVTE